MPPLRSAHRSLLTIAPHGQQSHRAHLFSPQQFGQLTAPFPVPQPGPWLRILMRQQPKLAESKPAPGWHEAIEAQIRDDIAVMQGVMISDLRQEEHPVGLEAEEVRRVIEVR